MAPRFSIVIPAYNAEVTLAETLDSVRAQLFDHWECIVVDDGSTDDTQRIATGFQASDPRYRLITQENQGTGGAYNAGVAAATGEFVVVCSADDVLLPEHLARMSSFIDAHPGYDIFSSNGYVWSESGSLDPRYSLKQEAGSLSLADVITECFYSVGATYRRSLFDKVGGYRVGIFGEDYDFWLRTMAAGARHRYVPALLSQHRVSRSQKSAQLEQWWRSDIGIVSDLMDTAALSERDLHAARRLVRDRERRLKHLRSRVRSTAAVALNRTLGAERVRGLLRSIRFAHKRRLRRG